MASREETVERIAAKWWLKIVANPDVPSILEEAIKEAMDDERERCAKTLELEAIQSVRRRASRRGNEY
jgi:hypothetical protein